MNGRRFCSGHSQRNFISITGLQKRLRAFLKPFFHGWSRDGKQLFFRSSPFRENGTPERPQTLRCSKIINIFPLKMPSNDDDRRQWRKQGGVVGAAASKTQVPPKARCGCWVPRPVRRGGHSKSSCGYLRSRQPCSTAAGCFPPAGRGRQGRAPSAGQGRRPAKRLPAGTPLPRRQDSPASCPENRRWRSRPR